MIHYIIQALYFMLPAYFANMAPLFVRKTFNCLAIPVDGGKVWRGKPILGSHKTLRGFIFGVLAAIGLMYLQQWLYQFPSIKNVSLLNYPEINPILYGFLFGFGALFGDSVKSFFKRRINIKPGVPWFPWDQLDLVFGSLIFISFVFKPPLYVIAIVLILHPILHVLVKHIAFYLHIEKTKW